VQVIWDPDLRWRLSIRPPDQHGRRQDESLQDRSRSNLSEDYEFATGPRNSELPRRNLKPRWRRRSVRWCGRARA